MTLRGLVLVLLAALSWAAANGVARSAGRIDALGFMVWSSLFAAPPLALISVLTEGGFAHVAGLVAAASPVAWATVAWQAVGNTLFGYGCWNWLLARHDAATVTPMALGVPVFGMAASAWALGESLPAWKLVAAALVMGGLALNLWAARRPTPGHSAKLKAGLNRPEPRSARRCAHSHLENTQSRSHRRGTFDGHHIQFNRTPCPAVHGCGHPVFHWLLALDDRRLVLRGPVHAATCP